MDSQEECGASGATTV